MAAENVTTFIFFRDEQSHGLGLCDPDRDDSISRENLHSYRKELITQNSTVFLGIYHSIFLNRSKSQHKHAPYNANNLIICPQHNVCP